MSTFLFDDFIGTGSLATHSPSIGGAWSGADLANYVLDGNGFVTSQIDNTDQYSVLASPSGSTYSFIAPFKVTNIIAGNTNRVLLDLVARDSGGAAKLGGTLNYHDSTYSLTTTMISTGGNYDIGPIATGLAVPTLNQVYTFRIDVTPTGTSWSIDGTTITSTPHFPDAIPFDAGFFAYSPGGVSVLKVDSISFGVPITNFWTGFVKTVETDA